MKHIMIIVLSLIKDRMIPPSWRELVAHLQCSQLLITVKNTYTYTATISEVL